MPLPDLDYQTLAVTPAPDLPTLVERLVTVAGMEPQPDASGDLQGVYRLDQNADGYLLTFPAAVDPAAVQQIIDGCPTTAELATQAQADATAAAWAELRMRRDRWLAQTDWIGAFLGLDTIPKDVPLALQDAITANADAWLTFRQQLRDLPGSTTDPLQVAWPTPPAAPVVHLT